jgi:predicted alpha/beta superfamily hydrolase
MGHMEIIKDLPFANGQTRDIYVYTPDTNEPSLLVVVYDGQFVFDLYPTKHPLGINLYADIAIKQGTIPPITIVGIESTADRLYELNPWDHTACKTFLESTVIPLIERQYKVKRPYINIGFSAGGQMAIYMSRYIGLFDMAGAILPLWIPGEHNTPAPYSHFTYIATHSQTDVDIIQNSLKNNVLYEIYPDACHTVDFFRKILPHAIEVLTQHASET